MLDSNMVTLIRAILFSLSFIGLSAAVRQKLKLNPFVAPMLSACAVLSILMGSGMLRVLHGGFLLLYTAGFAGLIYAYVLKKLRPAWGLIGLYAAFCAYLAWRYWLCPIYRADDVSHWGLVARYLLENDAFPNSSTDIVFFQSYPLGSASFIYYVSRAVSSQEGMWLIAQNLLMGILALPLFAHIGGNKKWLVPAAAGLFFYLFKYNRPMNNLQVDWLLAFYGVGAAAAVLYYRDNLKKALLVGIPAAIAVVYLKNSGMFFSMCTLVLLATVALRNGCKKHTALSILVLGTIGFACAYLLWTLHVKASFPAGLETKHAISLSTYAEQASDKGITYILTIARMMLAALVKVNFYQLFAYAFMAGSFALVWFACRKNPGLRAHRTAMFRRLTACIGIYALWYAMVFAMYVFSMPTNEALELASYYRYNATGLLYMMGLAGILLLDFFSRAEWRPALGAKLLYGIVLAGCAAVVLITDFTSSTVYQGLFVRETTLTPIRQRLQDARKEYDLPYGGSYLVFALDGMDDHIDVRNIYTSAYHTKYELYTADLRLITKPAALPDAEEYAYGTLNNHSTGTDPIGYVAENIASANALIIIDECPHFETLLEEYLAGNPTDIPVIYTYR